MSSLCDDHLLKLQTILMRPLLPRLCAALTAFLGFHLFRFQGYWNDLIKMRWNLCTLSLFCLEFPVLACEDQLHLFLIIHSTGVRQDEVSSSLRKWTGKGWSAVVLGEEVSPASPSVPGPLTLSAIHQLWCDSDRILPRSRVTVGVCDICPWWWNVGKALVLAADFPTHKALKNIFFNFTAESRAVWKEQCFQDPSSTTYY